MPSKPKVRTQKQILADNAKYNALPPLEKRVATAKEILKEVAMGLFIPEDGYGAVTIPDFYDWSKSVAYFPTGNLQEHIHKRGFQCVGCAKAAIIVARASLGNNVFCSEFTSSATLANEVSHEIFGQKCANIIESLYEGDDCMGVSGHQFFIEDIGERDAVNEYMKALPSRDDEPKERLLAIYQNIIDNKGHLVIGGYKF